MYRNGRLFFLYTAGLLAAGSIAFLWGGFQHPATGESLGPMGSDLYFQNFAHHIVSHRAWGPIHTGILLGPVLWMLGAAGLWAALRQDRESPLGSIGRTAFAAGATLWAVAFVFDGFVAPVSAAGVVAADPANLSSMISQLRSNQNVVIRVGLISWTLLGIGLALLSSLLFGSQLLRPVMRKGLAVTGILIGLWPAAAWALQIFNPGPFTSSLWAPTALATGLWFFVLGLSLLPGLKRAPELVPVG